MFAAVVGLLLGAGFPATFAADPRQARPNFVLLLGEGHGWSSTSVTMEDQHPDSRSGLVRTPNLERLAAEGIRFANFYAPSPRCTPSRASLLTGKSPARLHMTFVHEGRDGRDAPASHRLVAPAASTELPEEETTLAELLRSAGYATAHFGKWHLGRTSPTRHGFEESDGPTNNGGPRDVENPHPAELFGMTARGLDFVTRQARAGRPFFLQLSHYATRGAGGASPEALAAVRAWGSHLGERDLAEAAAQWDADLALGQLLTGLEREGVASNTYVLFTTDHGAPGRNPPFRGGKGSVFEGGLRVPLIIRGPGIPAGTSSSVRAVGADLFPTVAALAHVPGPLPAGLEGTSLADILAHPENALPARPAAEYVVHFPHYDKDPLGPASALWRGNLKLIRVYESGQRLLYDLAVDPGEHHDLADERRETAEELDRRLTGYLTSVGAQMPLPATEAPAPVESIRREPRRKQRP